MVSPDRPQHARVGRVAGLPLAPGRQLELLEEDPRHLLGRAEHELLVRELVRPGLELLEPVGEPGCDLAHAVGVHLHARVLHRSEDAGQRQLDRPVEVVETALGDPLPHRAREPSRGGCMTDQGRGLLLRLGLGPKLDAILGGQVVEDVAGSARFDQIGHEERVVNDVQPKGLGVVRNEGGLAELRPKLRRPRTDDDLVARVESDAAVLDGDPGLSLRRGDPALPPRNLHALDPHGCCRKRLVDHVDPLQQVPELVLAEHLLQPRAVGRGEHQLRGIAVERQVVPHRGEHLRVERLLGVLLERLAARG